MPAPLAVAALAARLIARQLAEKSAKKGIQKAASIAQKKAYKEKVTIPAKKVVKEAKASAKIEKKAIKAAQGKSLAPKKYKPDTEGRRQVKRFAAPLEKANGRKEAMRMAAQTIDIGRSSLRIKPAVPAIKKTTPAVRKTISGRVINDRGVKKAFVPKKGK